ncbi:hypothetical protein [Humibacter sp.]|uniref:hypothetical protein n=1 Tax=Humibacter sp. TaxID=1940291 RepID=UPI003F7E262C
MAYQSFGSPSQSSTGQPNRRSRSLPPGVPGGPTEPAYSPPDANGQGHAIPSPQPRPTFAQLQQSGQARPAPPAPPPAPQFQPQQSAVDPALQQRVQGQLQSPNPYGSDAVQRSYNLLSQNIDDQYKLKERATNEEMARRGLYDSTKAVGALSDLNIGQRDAKTQLAQQLLDAQAQSEGTYQNAAIQNALGYTGQQNSQSVANYLAQLQGSGQQFSQGLQGAQFSEQQRQSDLANALGQGQLALGQGNLDLARLGQQQNYGLAQQQFGLASQGQQQQYGLAQQQQQLAQQLGLGNLGLQQQQVANQQNQFGQSFGLQQQIADQAKQFQTYQQILQALGLAGQLGVDGGDASGVNAFLQVLAGQNGGTSAPPAQGADTTPGTPVPAQWPMWAKILGYPVLSHLGGNNNGN